MKVVCEDNEGMTLEYKTVYEDLTSFCLGMIEFVIIERYNVPKENLQVWNSKFVASYKMNRIDIDFLCESFCQII